MYFVIYLLLNFILLYQQIRHLIDIANNFLLHIFQRFDAADLVNSGKSFDQLFLESSCCNLAPQLSCPDKNLSTFASRSCVTANQIITVDFCQPLLFFMQCKWAWSSSQQSSSFYNSCYVMFNALYWMQFCQLLYIALSCLVAGKCFKPSSSVWSTDLVQFENFSD